MSDAEVRIDETYATIKVEDTDVRLTVEDNHIVIEDARSGPQGAAGNADAHFVHTQVTPSATWTINHNLGKFPAVEVVDSASNVVIGEVRYNNANTVTITFVAAFAGKAFFN